LTDVLLLILVRPASEERTSFSKLKTIRRNSCKLMYIKTHLVVYTASLL
jgi:hypothetical protein